MQFEHDNAFLASVSEDIIREFHDQVLSKDFVVNHPEVFLTNDWVDITHLRKFIRQRGDDATFPSNVPASTVPDVASRACVKQESIDFTHQIKVKDNNIIDLCGSPPDSTRLADDMDSEEEVEEPMGIEPNIDPLSSISPVAWLDDDIETTGFKEGKVSLSKILEVEGIQYIKGLPMAWPIPCNMITYVVDLSDEKYTLRDEKGDLIPMDV
ncbi:hypothetical protein BDQ17DRAFT_1430662 [Cyathus striatus]|nr:hypothetical protein BDQ17DRAFT_1430662 [Cyathus striatus]